jgi:hypothetical protein
MAEGKSSRKRYHLGRQQMLSWSIKNGRERDDCTFASRPDEITPVGTEIAAAGIQATVAMVSDAFAFLVVLVARWS